MQFNPDQRSALVPASAAEAALNRRSIRKYAPTEIPSDEISALLEQAGKAPSAFNVQPWRFIVVRDQALKEQLSAAAYGQQQVANAPAVIVMYSDMADALARMPEAMHPDMPQEKRDAGVASFRASFESKSEAEREAWGLNQSNIALGYLLLLAEAHGFGTSPMLGFDASRVKEILGLPEHVTIPALVAIGYPAEEGFRPHRLPIETLVEHR